MGGKRLRISVPLETSHCMSVEDSAIKLGFSPHAYVTLVRGGGHPQLIETLSCH